MSLRKETFVCRNCGIEKRATYSSNGFYCSNKCQREYTTKQTDIEWINGNTEIYKTNASRRRALTRLHGHKCYCCEITEWQGKEIVLELEHIDGNGDNNILENLALICPNCHSQTGTYKNRNKGKSSREYRRIIRN
jgi:5-methylcytosine-specific restriction endonuclease McrA